MTTMFSTLLCSPATYMNTGCAKVTSVQWWKSTSQTGSRLSL